MKKLFTCTITFLLLSCSENKTDCEEYSSPYWGTTMFNKPHNTRIKGENITIRKAFAEIKKLETKIKPRNGFITLRLNIDKNGNYCNQENFQINKQYQPIQFNNGRLIKQLENISKNLSGWRNDTETKTYYLIKLTIKNGRIEEIF